MKVKELIAKLSEKDGESEVYTEGCDCIGDVDDVEEFEGYGLEGILLTRSENNKGGV